MDEGITQTGENINESSDNNGAKVSGKNILIGVIVSVLVLGAAGFAYWKYSGGNINFDFLGTATPSPLKEREIGDNTTTKTETTTSVPKTMAKELPPIVPGKVTYNISTGPNFGRPSPTEITINPHGPKKGDRQTVTVKAISSFPITNLVIVLTTDNQTKTYPLELMAGTTLDGIWESSWKFEDTTDVKYVETIKTTNSQGTSSTDVTIR